MEGIMRRLLRTLMMVMLLAAFGQAFAQNWPTKPVKFILSQPPGTGPDIISRLFADRLSRM
jgi:tripartite-type tricarboxylate transporter receptor subunit TctC